MLNYNISVPTLQYNISFIAYNTNNTDYYVAFTPEQIKSATDNLGTFDKDNKDIRYSKELDSKLSMESIEKLRLTLR